MRTASYEHEGKAAEVLVVGERDTPAPGSGQVLVRIALSGINPSDVKTRAGATPRPIEGFQIPHMDGAGEIVQVGEGVDDRRIGQRVWLYLAAFKNRWGTSAEYTVVDEHLAVRLPEQGSFELGACLGVPALTAHECMFHTGPVKDRTILVHGGAGAVGHYAVQLARWAGATVITTVSNEDKAAQAQAAGAQHVVNYRDPDAIKLIQGLGPVDVITDVNLVDNWDLDMAVLAQGGSIVSYATDGRPINFAVRQGMSKGLRLKFFLLYTHPRDALERAAEQINRAIEAGALTSLPIVPFALEQVADAHEMVEAEQPGKVVLDLR